jgi:hypothetical protein
MVLTRQSEGRGTRNGGIEIGYNDGYKRIKGSKVHAVAVTSISFLIAIDVGPVWQRTARKQKVNHSSIGYQNQRYQQKTQE